MNKEVVIRFIVDFSVLAFISLSDTVLNFYGEPFKRGYFIDDETIQYPYKKGTVDFNLLVIIGTLGPAIIIIFVEFGIDKLTQRNYHQPSIPFINTLAIPGFLVASYKYVGMLWVGLAATEISTEIPKMLVGRLRPHFLDVCRPNVSALNSTTGYIVADICTGDDAYNIDEARRSFPSSHSSMAMFPALYLTLYLTYRLRPWSALRMPVFLFSGALLNLAFYVGLTRISDFKHHWTDVTAGLVLGAFVAVVITYIYGGKKFGVQCSSNENRKLAVINIK